MNVMSEPSLQDVLYMAHEVWSSFLGGQEPLLEGEPIADDAAVISATISVSGASAATISLEVPEPLAQTITAAMLGIGDATDADVSDAIGELVNVVGGNIKSLMAGPSTLSIPVVAHGRVCWPHGSREVLRADLSWAGQPLRIAVHAPVD